MICCSRRENGSDGKAVLVFQAGSQAIYIVRISDTPARSFPLAAFPDLFPPALRVSWTIEWRCTIEWRTKKKQKQQATVVADWTSGLVITVR